MKIQKKSVKKTVILAITIFIFLAILSCGSASDKKNYCSLDSKFQGITFNYTHTSLPLTQPPLIAGMHTDEKTTNLLDQLLDDLIEKTRIADFTVAIGIPGNGIWTRTKLSSPTYDHIQAQEHSIFWWMSVGKVFTSVLIHQLIDEGKLSLDDPISIWFPEIENSNFILIQHLLTHTSGIYSFQEDTRLREGNHYRSPYELLDIALSHDALFCPGTKWSYSNTNYVILGLILEKIEKKSYAELISERITIRTGMKSSYALHANEFPNNLILRKNGNTNLDGDIPSLPYSAGNIVSNSEDMITFLQSILTGKLISAAHLESIVLNTYPMFDNGEYYGRGLMLYKIEQKNSSLQDRSWRRNTKRECNYCV